jgi:hypothetical protein
MPVRRGLAWGAKLVTNASVFSLVTKVKTPARDKQIATFANRLYNRPSPGI